MKESLSKNNHIIIVTYNWPPRNAIGTHRAYAWARHWAEAGAEITVLTAEKQPFDGPVDLDLPNPSGVRVIEVPFARTTKLAGRALKFDFARRLAKKIKAWINRWGSKPFDPRSRWHSAARPTALQLAQTADIVVSTYGPSASHLIASDMKQSNPAIRWIADYRDLWSQSHHEGISTLARQAMRKEELASVGRFADLLTTVSDDLRRKLVELTGKSVLCVPNGFDIDEDTIRERLIKQPESSGPPFRIVYTGTLYAGLQDPRPLLDALDRMYSKGLIGDGEVTVDFYGSRLDPLNRLAEDPSYARFIEVKGHVTRNQALHAQRNADLLLLLESPRPEARGVLTGKLFEYIASGRPILSIGSRPEYEIGKVLAATGTGMTFGPEEYGHIDEVLLESIKGKGVYDAYAPEIEEIMKYSRERLAHDMFLRITE